MKRLLLAAGILSVSALASCAERDKQPEQAAPIPAPIVPQSPVSKFKGIQVQKPMMNAIPPASSEAVPAASADAAPLPK